ncbi:FlgD immunoglobulin-like domain containing protein, partial [Caldithrix abyssi]
SVHDLQGRHIRTLVDRHIEPGNYQVSWDGRNQWGISVPSGVYFVRMNADRFQAVRKVMFLK